MRFKWALLRERKHKTARYRESDTHDLFSVNDLLQELRRYDDLYRTIRVEKRYGNSCEPNWNWVVHYYNSCKGKDSSYHYHWKTHCCHFMKPLALFRRKIETSCADDPVDEKKTNSRDVPANISSDHHPLVAHDFHCKKHSWGETPKNNKQHLLFGVHLLRSNARLTLVRAIEGNNDDSSKYTDDTNELYNGHFFFH